MDLVELNLRGRIFKVPESVLRKSDHISGLLDHREYETQIIYINRSPTAFKHILEYLYDNEVRIPKEYLREMKFYATNYSVYNKNLKENIIFDVRGKEFKVRCDVFMNGCGYWNQELMTMLVGEVLYIDEDPSVFKHIVKRVYDNGYILPCNMSKYKLQPLNLANVKEVKIICNGKQYKFDRSLVDKSSVIKSWLINHDRAPVMNCDSECVDMLSAYLGQPSRYRDVRYKKLFETLKIEDNKYYYTSYRKCYGNGYGCENFIKIHYTKDNGKIMYVDRTIFYCSDHVCLLCHKMKYGFSLYCKEHKCKNEKCNDKVIVGSEFCEKHNDK